MATTLPSLFGRNGGDPFTSLFREVEKTFEDFTRRSPFGALTASSSAAMVAPDLDISEGKEGIEITAELPGVDEKDVDVTLSNGVLTIRGEKKSERDEKDKDKNWHVIERSYGSFSRSLRLPYEPDSDKIVASFDKGVLRVKLPKPAEMAKQEKKISIRKG